MDLSNLALQFFFTTGQAVTAILHKKTSERATIYLVLHQNQTLKTTSLLALDLTEAPKITNTVIEETSKAILHEIQPLLQFDEGTSFVIHYRIEMLLKEILPDKRIISEKRWTELIPQLSYRLVENEQLKSKKLEIRIRPNGKNSKNSEHLFTIQAITSVEKFFQIITHYWTRY